MHFSTTFTRNGTHFEADLSHPLDISIPLRAGTETVNCFYAPPMEVEPVVAGDFIGSTERGGPLNFLNVKLNPHGNGTHTECVGHIAKEKFTIRQCLTRFHFFAKLASLFPYKLSGGDRVITRPQIEDILREGEVEALILRTMPNDAHKLRMNYSGANPPYLHHEAMEYIVACGVQHLLVDLPSVDREEDGGELLSHHVFWKYPRKDGGEDRDLSAIRQNCTITELIFASDEIQDGLYLLNLQTASFEIDASPSKPVLYALRNAGD